MPDPDGWSEVNPKQEMGDDLMKILDEITAAQLAPKVDPEFVNVVIDNHGEAEVPRYKSPELHTYLYPRCRLTGDHDHGRIGSRWRFEDGTEVDEKWDGDSSTSDGATASGPPPKAEARVTRGDADGLA